VAVDHGLLDAVQVALVLEVFDGDQLLAVQGGDEGQAGIERAVAQRFSVQLADHDGAGTAVAGCTAFFGAGFAAMFTQVFQHGGIRIECLLTAQFSIEKKLDQGGPPGRFCSGLWRWKLALSDFSVKKLLTQKSMCPMGRPWMTTFTPNGGFEYALSVARADSSCCLGRQAWIRRSEKWLCWGRVG
jgi:hypothetical protein